MQAEGGRRIKRSINIKLSSIRFLSADDISEIKKIAILGQYLLEREKEIEHYNDDAGIDHSLLINGRRLTNVGVFRKYIELYLANNKALHKDMITMVRQLQPTEKGLPLELYTFTNDTRWARYEEIMADIFDHLLAAASYFELEFFELPASGDFKSQKLFIGEMAS